ncbi:phage portal protein [Streptomyces carpaticus]|uniref:phage portal protein n=1 Tax=Streptomyces carpaticus TaxID=285558 RepID=UPI0031F95CE2
MSRARRVLSWLTAPARWLGGAAKRAITSLPWASGGPRIDAGGDRAMGLVAVWACVRILSDSVASLPVQLYRRNGAQREPVSYVPALLWAPAAVDDLFQWLHKAVVSLALRGNAYGLVTQRDELGYPVAIEWLSPDDVWVDEQRPTAPVYYWQGRTVPAADVVHVPWIVMPGRVVGMSPVQAFARTIGVGLAATEYGARWFEGGGTPPATMRNSQKTIAPDQADEISDRLMARMRAGRPLVYGADWEFTALQVNPEESQFIETMKLNATQVAAIFGVPPEKVGGESGGSMTYANVEQAAIDFVTFTLGPWLVRLESVLSSLMPGNEFVRFNRDALIRSDTLTRYQAHGAALDKQWRTVNEIRAIEDLPPVPWGDTPNLIPGAPPEQQQEKQQEGQGS